MFTMKRHIVEVALLTYSRFSKTAERKKKKKRKEKRRIDFVEKKINKNDYFKVEMTMIPTVGSSNLVL